MERATRLAAAVACLVGCRATAKVLQDLLGRRQVSLGFSVLRSHARVLDLTSLSPSFLCLLLEKKIIQSEAQDVPRFAGKEAGESGV